MSGVKKARSRAVPLTPEALEILNKALTQKWQSIAKGQRLTREEKASLLGVSLATSERVLKGKPVDRPTLTHVFKSVGVAWDDSFCLLPKAESQESSLPQELQDKPPVPKRTHHLRRNILAGIAVFIVLVMVQKDTRAGSVNDWRIAYLKETSLATSSYHSADYVNARQHLESAISLARRNDNIGGMGEALYWAGQLAMVNGDYEVAKEHLESAYLLKTTLGAGRDSSYIAEGLGNAEVALGNYKIAVDHYKNSLKMAGNQMNHVMIAQAYRGLGTEAHCSGDLETAERSYDAGLALVANDAKEADLCQDLIARRALVWRDLGQLDKALGVITNCLEHWKRFKGEGHPRWIARTQLQLATIHFRKGSLDKASSLIQASREIYIALKDQSGVDESEAMLAAKSPGELGLAITSSKFNGNKFSDSGRHRRVDKSR